MTSKKITEMPIVQDLDGGDWLTGVDNSAAAADKNVRITKDDLLKGVVVQFFPVRRVEDMTAGGSVDIAVDGGAVTVNVGSGNAVTLTSSGSGQDDSANEYTASIDFIHSGIGGSVSVSINAAIEQMDELGAITVAVGVPVSAILRTRADGTVQLYRSTKA